MDTPDSRRRGGSVLSIDDPDVRIAAEALGDLRAGASMPKFWTFL
jgi:transcriptional repressor OPI1